MLNIKVTNMTSPKGNKVSNQFKIWTSEGWYFQSYDSIIVYRSHEGKITLDADYWDYSRTTGKYRNMFLNESKAETQKKIDNGTYKLVNLN
jgi:hypothetical protein